jgi:putative PIN family toxin of toxin-antitoxin system
VRIVLDTNIWVSGLLWKGLPWKLLRIAEQKKLELCTAAPILAELYEVLSYDRLQPRLQQLSLTPEELIAYVLDRTSVFEVGVGDPIVEADPDDDVFLHCAVTAGAAYVVSGGRHLLDLAEWAGIPILTTRGFLDRYFPDETADESST